MLQDSGTADSRIASAVWDPFTDDNIRKLEMVQRRAARMIFATIPAVSHLCATAPVAHRSGAQSPGKGLYDVSYRLQSCGFNHATGHQRYQ